MYLYIYLSHVCINITVGHCISTRVASRHVDLLDTSSCRQMLHDASRIGCKRPSFAPKMRSKDDLRCLWLSVQRPTLTLSKIIPTALQRGVSPGKTFPPWRANRLFFNRRWLWTEDNFQRRQDEVTSHQHDLDELQLDCRCGWKLGQW